LWYPFPGARGDRKLTTSGNKQDPPACQVLHKDPRKNFSHTDIQREQTKNTIPYNRAIGNRKTLTQNHTSISMKTAAEPVQHGVFNISTEFEQSVDKPIYSVLEFSKQLLTQATTVMDILVEQSK